MASARLPARRGVAMIRLNPLRVRLRALLRRNAVEQELDEELAFHIAMETEKNLRAGMTPAEARRQARIAFGGVERHREDVRRGRGLAWISGMSLDFTLGFRMLVKYPGLKIGRASCRKE